MELNVEYLVLAEMKDGSGRRLEIQRSLDGGDQDEALSHDTYCLVTADAATYYGGIRHWQIAASTLGVTLDAAAAQALRVDGFRILVPDAKCATVEAALRQLTT